jgi:hypothetical protein
MASTKVFPTAKLDVVNVALPELRVPEPRRVGARLVQFVADAQE